MEINKRIAYISFLIIGFIFILAGLALDEPVLLYDVYSRDPTEWYVFLMPWVGDGENGLPTPW